MERAVSFKDNVHIIEEHPCIVEFQAFIGNNNEFIIKELTFVDLVRGTTYYFLFKQPFPFSTLTKKAKTTNRWLMNNYHYIGWKEGFTRYKSVDDVMYHFCSKFNRFYTRGEEKRKWIQMYTSDPVINVLIDKGFKVEYHGSCLAVQDSKHNQSQCAMQNAYRLFTFLQYDECGGGNGCGGESGCGGDIRGYKYEDMGPTMHEYYSNLRGVNNYSSSSSSISTEDGDTGISPSFG